MQRQEIYNYTDEQVREHVSKAIALADELVSESSVWAAVFSAACTLYSGKNIVMAQPQPLSLPAMTIPRGR